MENNANCALALIVPEIFLTQALTQNEKGLALIIGRMPLSDD